eukprot:1187187-Prorocentrum_minimum.AAC.3
MDTRWVRGFRFRGACIYEGGRERTAPWRGDRGKATSWVMWRRGDLASLSPHGERSSCPSGNWKRGDSRVLRFCGGGDFLASCDERGLISGEGRPSPSNTRDLTCA